MASNPHTYQDTRRPRLGVNAANQRYRSTQSPQHLPPPNVNPGPSGNDGLSNEVRETLKCPNCTQTMESPIFMCGTGHNLCHACILGMNRNSCPICHCSITNQRNYALEKIAMKVISSNMTLECPNKTYGCVYKNNRENVAKHAEFCQFQLYTCPLFSYDSSCEWRGNISLLQEHFEHNHAHYMMIKEGCPITFKSVDLTKPDINIQLLTYENYLFLYHVRIDPASQTASWTLQYVGCDDIAKNWQYELHIYLASEPWKKIMIADNCLPYSRNVQEVFSLSHCPAIPLRVMRYYCNSSGDFTFKFYLKNKTEKKMLNVSRQLNTLFKK